MALTRLLAEVLFLPSFAVYSVDLGVLGEHQPSSTIGKQQKVIASQHGMFCFVVVVDSNRTTIGLLLPGLNSDLLSLSSSHPVGILLNSNINS